MSATLRRRLFLSSAGMAVLAACASTNPTLYTLAPVPGAPHPGAPPVVVLREISLARYLERPQIVRSSASYQLDVMVNDWWGEPLGAMLGRILVETAILLSMHNQTDAAKILHDAAHVYKVDVDAISATVKREFAAKGKGKASKKATPKSAAKPAKNAAA